MNAVQHFGILCALPHEAQAMLKHLEADDDDWIGAMHVWQGTAGGKQVTLVQCGMGKVSAAAAAQLLLDRFEPDALISCGTAGSLAPELALGTVLVGERTLYHDYGFQVAERLIPYRVSIPRPGRKPEFPEAFAADAALLRLARSVCLTGQSAPNVVYGTIVTGDQVILSSDKRRELRTEFQALAVEMESAAIAQVAYLHHAPFLAVRAISDQADENLPLDLAALDPNEFGAYPSAPLPEKISLLAKAITCFARHPAAFALTLEARRQIKQAALNAAAFTIELLNQPAE